MTFRVVIKLRSAALHTRAGGLGVIDVLHLPAPLTVPQADHTASTLVEYHDGTDIAALKRGGIYV